MFRYTPDMIEWLREWYPRMENADVLEKFRAEFGTAPTKASLQTKMSKLGIKKPRTVWSDELVSWFISFVPGHSEREISDECERLFGHPLSDGHIGNAKNRYGVKSGTHGGRFKKGHVPFNKGLSWDEQGRSEESREASLRTCFKTGEIQDRPDGWIKPIGFERKDRDGYTYVKVRDSRESGPQRQYRGNHNENYRMKHHVIWEQHNGPIPPSTVIVFADRDKTNFDPDNLVAVSRKNWSVISRMHMDYANREQLEACINRARLHRAMVAKRKELSCNSTAP